MWFAVRVCQGVCWGVGSGFKECLWCSWGREGFLSQFWLVPCLSGVFLLIRGKCVVALVGPLYRHFVEFGGVPFIAALAD